MRILLFFKKLFHISIEDTGVNQHINGTQDNSRTTIINHEHV
jgi:hypothetical protein